MRGHSSLVRQVSNSATSTSRHLARPALPLASTSRPVLSSLSGAQPAPSSFSLGSVTPTRSIVTIPHPDLDLKHGYTNFVVRTFDYMPTMVHALAVVRAVEARLGPVLSVDVPKDADSLRPSNLIFIYLLRPVPFDKPILLEIPAPALSRESNHLGGPSFNDVSAALRTSPATSDVLDPAPQGSLIRRAIQFRIELSRKPPPTARWKHANVTPTASEKREDDEIVRALQAFGTGFFGGMQGVAEKYQHLTREKGTQAASDDVQQVPELRNGGDRRAARENGIGREDRERQIESRVEDALFSAVREAAAFAPKPSPTQSSSSPTAETESTATLESLPEYVSKSRLDRLREQALDAARREVGNSAASTETATTPSSPSTPVSTTEGDSETSADAKTSPSEKSESDAESESNVESPEDKSKKSGWSFWSKK